MKDIEIGIIGGTRGMGEWFARFLKGNGYAVHVSGRKRGISAAEMADRCRVVVVSVPISVTGAVIETVGPHMRKDALLMDLTSLKQGPVEAMLKASVSEVIGCHPLFGPQFDSIKGQRVVLCPARGDRWLSWIKDILEKNGAGVVITTPEIHDRMMGIVQALNHFNTIMMGLVLSEGGVAFAELMRFATPNFQAKAEIVQKVFGLNPGLYSEIVTMNPHTRQLIDMYEKTLRDVKDLIVKGEFSALAELIGKHTSFYR